MSSSENALGGKKILVAEDEYWLAEEVTRALRHSGAQVIGPVRTQMEGIQRAQREVVDAAVLDVDLRGEPVVDLARLLGSRGVPVILATGYEPSVLPPELTNLSYIPKPVDIHVLMRMLSSVLVSS